VSKPRIAYPWWREQLLAHLLQLSDAQWLLAASWNSPDFAES
jgi:hypothetical protein